MRADRLNLPYIIYIIVSCNPLEFCMHVSIQEVAVLAKCRNDNITEYYASVLKPGSSELLIVMELMAASVADLVRVLQSSLHH